MGERQLWERVVAGHFVLAKRSFWPNFFSQIVARLQWNPMAIDLAPDARAWAELPAERRDRLTTLLAGFCVGTFVFHVVRGRPGFAMGTLPWATSA